MCIFRRHSKGLSPHSVSLLCRQFANSNLRDDGWCCARARRTAALQQGMGARKYRASLRLYSRWRLDGGAEKKKNEKPEMRRGYNQFAYLGVALTSVLSVCVHLFIYFLFFEIRSLICVFVVCGLVWCNFRCVMYIAMWGIYSSIKYKKSVELRGYEVKWLMNF